MPRIVVRIPSTGLTTGAKSMTIEGEGFTGTACVSELQRLASRMSQSSHVVDKPEMFEQQDMELHIGDN